MTFGLYLIILYILWSAIDALYKNGGKKKSFITGHDIGILPIITSSIFKDPRVRGKTAEYYQHTDA